MRFYIALAVFFACHALSTLYASEMARIRGLGSVSYWKYAASDPYYYVIYKTKWAMACYLNGEILIDCEEL